MHYYSNIIFNHLDVEFSYQTISGEVKKIKTKLYLSEPKNFVEPIKERSKSILKQECSDEIRYYLEYILAFNDSESNTEIFSKWERISKVVTVIESGNYYNYLRSEGEKVVCFRSYIDNSIDYYTVTLPRAFCPIGNIRF